VNGDLITKAESEGFDLMITTDQGIRYQQNWSGRSLALLVLDTNDWTRIRRFKDQIRAAVDAVLSTSCIVLEVPRGD
jgi:hypothetical protein